MLDVLAALEVTTAVVFQHGVASKRQEQARVECLWTVLTQLQSWCVDELVAEVEGSSSTWRIGGK